MRQDKDDVQGDLEYHERCRAVCALIGDTLHGSSINAGFHGTHGGDVSHQAMECIERLARENAALKAERDNASRTLPNLNIDVGYKTTSPAPTE